MSRRSFVSIATAGYLVLSWQARLLHYPVPDPHCTPGGTDPTVTTEVLGNPAWRNECIRNCAASEADKHIPNAGTPPQAAKKFRQATGLRTRSPGPARTRRGRRAGQHLAAMRAVAHRSRKQVLQNERPDGELPGRRGEGEKNVALCGPARHRRQLDPISRCRQSLLRNWRKMRLGRPYSSRDSGEHRSALPRLTRHTQLGCPNTVWMTRSWYTRRSGSWSEALSPIPA